MTRPIVIALVLVAAAAVPFSFGEYYVNLASQMLIAAIFAASLNLLVGYGGLPSLGHAAWLGLSAYVCAWMTLRAGTSAWTAAAIAITGTMAVA